MLIAHSGMQLYSSYQITPKQMRIRHNNLKNPLFLVVCLYWAFAGGLLSHKQASSTSFSCKRRDKDDRKWTPRSELSLRSWQIIHFISIQMLITYVSLTIQLFYPRIFKHISTDFLKTIEGDKHSSGSYQDVEPHRDT